MQATYSHNTKEHRRPTGETNHKRNDIAGKSNSLLSWRFPLNYFGGLRTRPLPPWIPSSNYLFAGSFSNFARSVELSWSADHNNVPFRNYDYRHCHVTVHTTRGWINETASRSDFPLALRFSPPTEFHSLAPPTLDRPPFDAPHPILSLTLTPYYSLLFDVPPFYFLFLILSII